MKRSFVFCVLFVFICLTWTAGPRVGEAGTPFPDIVGPELWIDGPDAVWPGSPVYPDVAVDNMGRRIHVWSAAGTGLVSTEVFMRRWDSIGTPSEIR